MSEASKFAPLVEWLNREAEKNRVVSEAAKNLAEFGSLDSALEAKKSELERVKKDAAEYTHHVSALQTEHDNTKKQISDASAAFEKKMTDALAQHVVDRDAMISNARQQATQIITEAKVEAARILDVAQQEHDKRKAEADKIRAQTEDAKNHLVSLHEQHEAIDKKTQALRDLASSIVQPKEPMHAS